MWDLKCLLKASQSCPLVIGSLRTHVVTRSEQGTQTLTVGVLWEASCCRSGKGVHWMGSTGQLHTERSLALPESKTPSPTLTSLPLQPYWELQGIQRGLLTHTLSIHSIRRWKYLETSAEMIHPLVFSFWINRQLLTTINNAGNC